MAVSKRHLRRRKKINGSAKDPKQHVRYSETIYRPVGKHKSNIDDSSPMKDVKRAKKRHFYKPLKAA